MPIGLFVLFTPTLPPRGGGIWWGGRSYSCMIRKIITLIAFLLMVGLAYYGIRTGDFYEVQVHGSVMCLSCMGIE